MDPVWDSGQRVLELQNKHCFLTLCKEFAKTDSRFGISGICPSSIPGMDISGTSYSQIRLELVDPFRADSGSSKKWLSSSVCLLRSDGFALCEHKQQKPQILFFFILQMVKNYFEVRVTDKIQAIRPQEMRDIPKILQI